MFGMAHSHVRHDAFIHDLTHLYVWHDAFICVVRLHTATHCNTLQHTATHCNTLHDAFICVVRLIHTCDMTHSYVTGLIRMSDEYGCSVLQCVAVCCSVLQCAASFVCLMNMVE